MSLRVLLVGMTHADNPFTRALQKYRGVEVEMLTNDVGDRHFRAGTAFDSAIFANAVIGHNKFWKIKDHCKAHGIKQFHSSSGFSPIKEQFENWLQERGHTVILNGHGNDQNAGGALAQAFKKAAVDTPLLPESKTLKVKKVEPVKTVEPVKKVEPVEVKPVEQKYIDPQVMGSRKYAAKCLELIAQAMDEGLDADQTIHRLKSLGYRSNSTGADWHSQMMHSMRYQAKTKGLTKARVGENYKAVAVPVAPATVQAPVAPTPKPAPAPPMANATTATGFLPKISTEERDKLMGRVFASKLPTERKLQLVEEIYAGLITSDSSVMAVRSEGKLSLINRSILALEDTPLLILDKVMAIAIMQAFNDIKAFVEQD